MDNQWAEPEGYPEGSKPIRYLIRKHSGDRNDRVVDDIDWRKPIEVEIYDEVVEHKTQLKYDFTTIAWHHGLDPYDQVVADMITAKIQQACGYFYEDDEDYTPLEYVADVRVTDEEVRERIKRINKGENVREANRINKDWYDLEALPFRQQRALVENIEAIKQMFGIEILGE